MNLQAFIVLTVFLGHLGHTNGFSLQGILNDLVKYPKVQPRSMNAVSSIPMASFEDIINNLVEYPKVQARSMNAVSSIPMASFEDIINNLVEYPKVQARSMNAVSSIPMASFEDIINNLVEYPKVQARSMNAVSSIPMASFEDIINNLVEYPEVQARPMNTFSSMIEASFGNLINGLVKYPKAQTRSMNDISSIPRAIASLIGIHDLPSIENNNNMGLPDDLNMEYIKGLTNEDARLSGAELIIKYGFPLEIHNVETEDGYKLKVYRIRNDGPAVFLMHGLLGSSDDYIVAGPESGLAYLLAREGYDVWMGNARGNKYSRAHKSLNPSEKKFWDFSWHQIGVYDLPAMIDCVLKETKRDTLKYIGHSQGTTSFFVMASERPEYNDKISVMVALSPVAFMSNMKSPIIRLLAPGGPLLETIFETLGIYEFLPNNNLVIGLQKALCEVSVLSELLCSNIGFLVFGFDVAQVNVTNLPVIYEHMPSSASIYQLVHYGQGVVTGEFAKFDYGFSRNEKVYGVRTPPRYELGNVRAPVALFYSDGDWLAHPSDVEKLSKRLSNVVDMYKVPNEKFNHLDFILAKDVKTLIYNRLQNVLKSF